VGGVPSPINLNCRLFHASGALPKGTPAK
jgi:hypothetical protein